MLLETCALVAAGIICHVILVINLKRDLSRLERRCDVKISRLEERVVFRLDTISNTNSPEQKDGVRRVEAKLDEVASRVGRLERDARPRNPANAELTPRGKIIQMAEQGTGSGVIAATVRIPRNEVDLVLKVHRAMAKIG